MTRKKWAALCLTLLFLGIFSTIALVMLVDPFEIYHQATAFIPPIDNSTQSYSNAGIAKNYTYDSVIIGSSMTENFAPSQFDALLGGRFVKLPINGGSSFNHRQMMEMAFRTHDIRRVFYGIDLMSLTYFYTTPKAEMPTYLYSDTLLDDTAYWFNRSVLLRYIPACLRTWGQHDPDLRDTMYNWSNLYAYGKEAALRGVTFSTEDVPQDDAPNGLSQQSKLNVEHNILPFIEAHPDTEFFFFFPPYSLAYWYQFYQDGTFAYHLSQKEALTEILLTYPNVKVYDFQARLDWILDLDRYIDTWHFDAGISEAIATAVSVDACRLTSVSQAAANDDVLRTYVDKLRQAGCWPDSFD